MPFKPRVLKGKVYSFKEIAAEHLFMSEIMLTSVLAVPQKDMAILTFKKQKRAFSSFYLFYLSHFLPSPLLSSPLLSSPFLSFLSSPVIFSWVSSFPLASSICLKHRLEL